MRFYAGGMNEYIHGLPEWSINLIREDYRDAILETSFHLPDKKPIEKDKVKKTVEDLSEKQD